MEELELREYWEIVRKHWRLVLAIPLIAALVSGALSWFVLKPQYQAQSTILVNQKQNDNPSLMYQDILANQALVKTYSQIIRSRKIEQNVIDTLRLPYTTDQLDHMISVNSPDQSEVIQVAVTAPNQPLAARIANQLAQDFQQQARSITNIQNVQIVDPAVADPQAAPVKPNKKLNVAIAFVLGLMVSIGIAFLLEYLDTRLRSEEDIRRYLELPVLGTVIDYTPEGEWK
ncbi:MAG: capsular biosynthesis protein [Alicyclobacillus sp.]|nr:capsular biosynthesis protein [Alicyclobacillus sp.]